MVAVRDGRFEYRVDQHVKGDLEAGDRVIVRSAPTETQCGLRHSPDDESVGVLLTRAGSDWASSLCAQTTAGELLDTSSGQRGDRLKLAIGLVVLAAVLGYSLRRLRRRPGGLGA